MTSTKTFTNNHSVPVGTAPVSAGPASTGPARGPVSSPATVRRRLQAVLALNAGTSAVAGSVALFAPGFTTRLLGAGSATLSRIVGAALLAFAVDVALAASGRLHKPSLGRAARLISALDVAWVLASVVVLVDGGLRTRGVVIGALQAVGVADFALLQLWLARRLAR